MKCHSTMIRIMGADMYCFIEYYPKLPVVFVGKKKKLVHTHTVSSVDEIPPSVPYPRESHSRLIVGLTTDDFK